MRHVEMEQVGWITRDGRLLQMANLSKEDLDGCAPVYRQTDTFVPASGAHWNCELQQAMHVG